MKRRFSEVLAIINGRNQKKVENPQGKYPIYGSGGIMGHADDYLCEENTVIIGRKGNINKPLFVKEKFWNVDTAFGLAADCKLLHPKYLYYFCCQYDFERLNKTVTIPSLTKSDLLEIELELPPLKEQEEVAAKLEQVDLLIDKCRQRIEIFDMLVKSRFVEMFGDYRLNNKQFDKQRGKLLFNFSSGKFLSADKRAVDGVPVYGGNGIAWYTEQPLIDYPTIVIGRVGAWCGNVHLVNVPAWITDNAIYIKEYKCTQNLTFLLQLMEFMNFRQYAEFSGQPKITQKPLEETEYIVPPITLQNQFADFVALTDKSKIAIQKSIGLLELLKASLMQTYFGQKKKSAPQGADKDWCLAQ